MDKMQNYSDLFFFFRFEDNYSCVHRFTSHALVYVYSGELEIAAPGQALTLKTGEAVFVREETCLRLAVCRKGSKEMKIAIIRIPENFLREFYFTTEKQENILDVPDQSLFFIQQREDIDSLFCSMIPYYGTDIDPGEKILKLKIIEAIYALLDTDRIFYKLLFGFAQDERISVLDLLADICILPFCWYKNGEFPFEPTNKLN